VAIDLARVKAICFDVDGTLIDTDDQFVLKLERYLSPIRFLFRQRNSLRIARRLVMFTEGPGNWIYSLSDRLGWDGRIVSLGDRFYEMGIGDHAEPYMLIPGVHEMLVALKTRLPISIISARGQKSTFRFLSQFELVPFFTAIATGQTCMHTKPYPDPLEWVALQMGVSPSDCLVVGDTVVDIVMGKRAGAQTVGVLCGFGEEHELSKAGADLILKNTVEVLDLFA